MKKIIDSGGLLLAWRNRRVLAASHSCKLEEIFFNWLTIKLKFFRHQDEFVEFLTEKATKLVRVTIEGSIR